MPTEETFTFQLDKIFKMRWLGILLFGTLFILVGSSSVSAQRFAYIDSEYILGEMPEYAAAQNELDVLAEQWSKELADKRKEVDRMYRAFKAEQVLMTEKMRKIGRAHV